MLSLDSWETVGLLGLSPREHSLISSSNEGVLPRTLVYSPTFLWKQCFLLSFWSFFIKLPSIVRECILQLVNIPPHLSFHDNHRSAIPLKLHAQPSSHTLRSAFMPYPWSWIRRFAAKQVIWKISGTFFYFSDSVFVFFSSLYIGGCYPGKEKNEYLSKIAREIRTDEKTAGNSGLSFGKKSSWCSDDRKEWKALQILSDFIFWRVFPGRICCRAETPKKTKALYPQQRYIFDTQTRYKVFFPKLPER